MSEDLVLVETKKHLDTIGSSVQKLFKKKTPKEVIKFRRGAGGKMFPYVPIDYTISELDKAFGIFWEFIIDDVKKTEKHIVVRGRLIVKSPNGFSISRPGIGRASIKFYQGTTNAVDEGNDEKAATSDAIKKAASLFGIASDVYYKELEKYEDMDEVINQEEENKQKAMSHFFGIAADRGFTADKAKERIKEIYKVEHMEDLSSSQIEATTRRLESAYQVVEPGEEPLRIGESRSTSSEESPTISTEKVMTTSDEVKEPEKVIETSVVQDVKTIPVNCRQCEKIVTPESNYKYFCSLECSEAYWGNAKNKDRDSKFKTFLGTGKMSK